MVLDGASAPSLAIAAMDATVVEHVTAVAAVAVCVTAKVIMTLHGTAVVVVASASYPRLSWPRSSWRALIVAALLMIKK